MREVNHDQEIKTMIKRMKFLTTMLNQKPYMVDKGNLLKDINTLSFELGMKVEAKSQKDGLFSKLKLVKEKRLTN